MAHQNEPPGNQGVTLNGRPMTEAEKKAIRDALGIIMQKQVTLKAKETITVAWGQQANVIQGGTDTDVEFTFEIPEGRPGIDGHGSIESVEAVGLPFGQPPAVVNFGTPEIAKLRFFVPAGPKGDPGIGIPPNPVEDFVISFKNGVTVWVPQAAGTGTGTGGNTTIINNIYNVDKLQGKYAWELPTTPVDPIPVDPGTGGGTTPPPAQTTFDATTYLAYSAAIAATPKPNRRSAAADAVIAAMGTVQKLALKRDGVTVVTINYSGQMTKALVGQDWYVSLATMGTTSLISAADADSGTWIMEISGGTNFARTIKLPVSPDFDTTPGNGINPGVVSLLIPRSMDQ